MSPHFSIILLVLCDQTNEVKINYHSFVHRVQIELTSCKIWNLALDLKEQNYNWLTSIFIIQNSAHWFQFVEIIHYPHTIYIIRDIIKEIRRYFLK